jgi:predicted RNA binding protein YcfA (HicA-like mRNA interferase family)
LPFAQHSTRIIAKMALTVATIYDINLIVLMPRKIRQLIAELERAGFANRGGKGSHRNFEHPAGARVVLSGKTEADAHHYQERAVQRGIREAKGEKI